MDRIHNVYKYNYLSYEYCPLIQISFVLAF